MHHLLAFNGTLAANAAYAQVAGVNDGSFPKNAAGDFLMPWNGRVIAHHVIGATTVKAQIQAPSMRKIAYPELYPLNITARTAIPDMNRYQTYGLNGPRFQLNDSMGVYASEGSALPSATSAALWVTDQWEDAPGGEYIALVATVTITTVDGAWALGNLAFDTQLAVGKYAVVGMDVVGDNAIYARLLFAGDTGMRPGVPVADVNTDVAWKDSFRYGRIGKYGEFESYAPPQLEVFGAAAATPFRVILDVVKIR